MGNLSELYCVQVWDDEAWKTIYVSSFHGDADEVFRNELYSWDGPRRLALFTVDGVDFIATHARDFKLVKRAG